MSYCIVAFHYTDGRQEVAVVHRKWLAGEKCYWPNFWKNTNQLNAALKQGTEPDPTSWVLYTVHVVGNRFYDSFDEARRNLKTAESGSEFSSGGVYSKSRRQKRKANQPADVDGSDSSCENDPTFSMPSRKKAVVSQPKVLASPPRPPSNSPSGMSQGPLVNYGHPSLVEVQYETNSQVGSLGEHNHAVNNLFVEPNSSNPNPGNPVYLLDATRREIELQPDSSVLDSSSYNQHASPTILQVLYNNQDSVNATFEKTRPAESTKSVQGPIQMVTGKTQGLLNNMLYNVTPQRPQHYSLINPTPRFAPPAPSTAPSTGSSTLAGDIQHLLGAVAEIQKSQILLTAKVDNIADMTRTFLQGHQGKQALAQCQSNFSMSLPIDSMESFDEIEEKIRVDIQEKELLIANLAARGGDTINNITYRLVGTLMTDSLMLEFTYAGQSGKRSFKDTLFLQCICEAVRRNRKGSVATDREIEKAIEYWLKKASERINRKMKSKKSTKSGSNPSNNDVDVVSD